MAIFHPHSRRSRNRIASIANRPAYRLSPTTSRQRGLAAIGFELQPPNDVDVQPIDSGETVVRCSERRADGKTVGVLEVAVFRAALLIDRDGILEEKVQAAAGGVAAAVPVALPGASGFRADIVARGALPYVYVFAMAPHDLGVDGGVLVTVRCATPDWPAADAIMRSLRILDRRGACANDGDEPALLPLIGATSGDRSGW